VSVPGCIDGKKKEDCFGEGTDKDGGRYFKCMKSSKPSAGKVNYGRE